MSDKQIKRARTDEESYDVPLIKYAKHSHNQVEPTKEDYDSDDEPLIKYRKINHKQIKLTNDENAKSNQINFTEINDDCLEQIFIHLSVMDLLNIVTTTNARIGNVARYVFSRKFAGRYFEIGRHTSPIHDYFICKTKACAFLDAFGSFITNIELSTDLQNYNDIEKKLSDICSQSLKSLVITGNGSDSNTAFQFLQKPFENVEYLELCEVLINSNSQLHEWFPNLQDLYYAAGDGECIEQHFSNLKRVRIESDYLRGGPASIVPDQKTIIKMLELNPQIRELRIEPSFSLDASNEQFTMDCELFEIITEKHPNLTELSMRPLHFDEPHKIWDLSAETLADHLEDGDIDDARKALSATFEKLEMLNLYDCWIWNDDWTAFVLRHKNLEFLTIECLRFDDLPVDIESIISHLPKLKSLSAFGCTVSIDQLEAILGENSTIRELIISKNYDETSGLDLDIDLFINMPYSDKWNIIDMYDDIQFSRKETLT